MDIYEALENAEGMIAEAVDKGRAISLPEQLGLDERASYGKLIAMEDAIVATSESDNRVLSYYGGFEYVSSDHVAKIGRYTIYFVESVQGEECSRIQSCLDTLARS